MRSFESFEILHRDSSPHRWKNAFRTVPVHTSEVERGFLLMNRVKQDCPLWTSSCGAIQNVCGSCGCPWGNWAQKSNTYQTNLLKVKKETSQSNGPLSTLYLTLPLIKFTHMKRRRLLLSVLCFARLFGDEAEITFWEVALHYLRREKARLLCLLHKVCCMLNVSV